MTMLAGLLVLQLLVPAWTSPLPPAEPLPTQVMIDVGHGGVDGGAVYQHVYEKEINLAVGRLLQEQLQSDGYQVVINRNRDVALSEENTWFKHPSRHLRDLTQRVHLIRKYAPQLVISLHCNWSSQSRARGALVLYQANNQSFMLADLIQHALNTLTGVHTEPRSGKAYYLLNHSPSPTVIVEMGYISNDRERRLLSMPAYQRQVAQTIAQAVNQYVLLVNRLP